MSTELSIYILLCGGTCVCASQRELPIMFLLSVVEDNIKVSPEQFGRDLTEVIIEQLEIKYLNKVSA